MNTTGKKIERYGHLSKIETLKSVSFQKLSGTVVLEAPEPFPGSTSYYSETPHLAAPLYIYFVLDGFADLELVSRATQKVRTIFPWDFSAAFCAIEIGPEHFSAIRVRDLNDFEQVPKLQEAFQKVGINFKMSSRNVNGKSLITLKKLFQLIQYEDGMYLDQEEKNHGYFSVPWQLPHEDFRELVRKVKYNWNIAKIDVAQGWYYSNEKVVNLIRIYTPGISLEILDDIKKQFLIRF